MRIFAKSRASWTFIPLLCLAFGSATLRAEDITAMAGGVTQGGTAMAAASAGDMMASGVDCSCMAMGVPCPSGAAGMCAQMGANAASMIQSAMQAMSGSATQDAVEESDTGADRDKSKRTKTKKTKGFDYDSFASVFKDECSKPNPPKYLCKPGGFDDAKNDLEKYKAVVDAGLIVPTPDEIKTLEKAESDIAALARGDFGAILSDDGSDFSDYSSGTAGRSGAASASTGNANSASGASYGAGSRSGIGRPGSGGNALLGPVNAKLDRTQWNGMLDAIDPNTGKSLTMWERATRRYMGTPDGQRGFTLARIESLRKQSTRKLASEVEASKPENEEEATYRPVVISPKEYSKH